MKILVLSDRYPPYYEGGYELNCHKVTEGLRTLGHTCTVLTTTFGRDIRVVEGHIHRVLNTRSWRPRSGFDRRSYEVRILISNLQNYRMTRKIVDEIQPDVAFIWNAEGMSILPILALQDAGIPTVFRLASHWLCHVKNDYVNEGSRLRRWYRSALLGFRRFEEIKLQAAAMATASLQESYQEAGFDVAETIVIPNAIPAEWIASAVSDSTDSEKRLRLLYAGRFEAAKGPDVILKAIAYLVNERGYQHLCLDLVGTGEPEFVALLKELVDLNHLGDIVRFIDFIPQQELVNRYSEYDVLLAASLRWEGFGMTLIEAMAKGLVVIASDIGGPKDIVTDGHDGFLVPPSEPILLANAIERLITEPALRASLGASALQTVRQKYVLDKVINHHEAYLKVNLSSDIRHQSEN